MSLVTLTIDGRQVQVPPGTTILAAARQAGVKIPTLCYLEELNIIGACRLCLVQVEGARALVAACVTQAGEGMVVHTSTPAVRHARRLNLELIMSNHPQECLTCLRNTSCELQQLAAELGVGEIRLQGEMSPYEVDDSSPSIIRDPRKCVLCRRCVSVCEKVQGVSAIAVQERGFDTVVAPAFLAPLGEVNCVNCGQCSLVCPTAAIHERDETDKVWAALADPEKHVVVQTAPAVRVSIGEMFGLEPGSIVTGKLVAALRRLGFDKVFDTDFSADLTIMEEGNELIHRLQNGGRLPLITSCSPGWIKFIEHFYPNLLPNLSTCKSPQQMFGALAKTYYAQKEGIDPARIFVVSIMPCTAKKYEAGRPEMNSSGYRDVDVVLTTRELGRMLKQAGIDFESLPEEDYDAPLGISTGAGVIFGATGGVMEAALRTAYELVTGATLFSLDFEEVRGLEGVKEASVNLAGTELKVAVAHGLGNARKVLDAVVNKEKEYHFIEIMCCPGGCIGGGGQPVPVDNEIRARRIAAIYQVDRQMPLRKSHENPAVQALYREFLGEPLSHKSHELLHTQYTPRERF
ncbi:NADH-quinone oxidoreductase subunit G/NADP-reducing hydrogenase subunit HndD [Desulfofundulus luciae]|uniref:NADH-quinone oxidoreductase subunit G/NADP-reducing hydrogenase subunit HndD n=1 Tax=Desulfofundulus luciae TaxID=74702 RepID=A0ABU0B4L1_9FIRM|nr:NADH-dependent [FeFe] hydrogenase, group A6 [Desulfofundulus luciae]MDQ0287215.1 NADH-quinone oxidoreductase subunit G/NADP-reducing hydrogenase subunit HndD [Desulfofundulus luciae]